MGEESEYYTHPDRMRGATRRKQNAMMHLQLKSYETMVQAFNEKHETRALHRALARVIPYNRRVRSLHALNHYTNQWYSDRGNEHVSDHATMRCIEAFNHEIPYLKQLKALFDDRIYSVLFEFYYEMVMEEIPQASKLVEKGRRASNEVRGSSLLVMSSTKGYAALNESMPVQEFYDISKDCEKLFEIIHQLQQIDVRWGSLLKSEEIDVELFDPDLKGFPNYLRFEAVLRLIPDVMRKTQKAIELAKSWWYQAERIRRRLRGQKIRESTTSEPPVSRQEEVDESVQEYQPDTEQETHDQNPTTPYRPAPRHTPDHAPEHNEYFKRSLSVDYKRNERQPFDTDEEGSERPAEGMPYNQAYRSFDSGTQDEEYPSQSSPKPKQQLPQHSYPAVREMVERRIKELSTSIALAQMDLDAETNELQFFNRRQQRIRKLRSNLKRAINVMEAMHDELKGYRQDKEKLILQLADTEDIAERRYVAVKLKVLDDKVKDVQELSDVIEYRHKLMASDLKLELDLRETFTRYQNEVRERVERLKSSVRDEEENKTQLENELMLLRLQAGLDGQESAPHNDLHSMNRGHSVPKKQVKNVPTLGNQRQAFNDPYGIDDDLDNENRVSYSPDLFYDHLITPAKSSISNHKRPDQESLTRASGKPDLLNHSRHTSDPSRVEENDTVEHDTMNKPQKERTVPKYHRHPQDELDPFHPDQFRNTQNRPSKRKQNKKNSVPVINYFPPSPKDRKRHRTPKVPMTSASDGGGDIDDSTDIHRDATDITQLDSYQDSMPSFNSRGDGYDGRNGQKKPTAPTQNGDHLSRSLNRTPRTSLRSNKKGKPFQKQPRLPQLREEDSSPAPRQGRTPKMYDPKRERPDSILSSYSPLPLSSYSPSLYDQGVRGGLGDSRDKGGGSGGMNPKKKAKPKKIKTDQPDLLTPIYKPKKSQGNKQIHNSRIPVKYSF